MSKETLIPKKQFAKHLLRTAFFYVCLFPLVEFLFFFVDKKEYQ